MEKSNLLDMESKQWLSECSNNLGEEWMKSLRI